MAQHVRELVSKLLSNVIVPASMVVIALRINSYMTENVSLKRNVLVTLMERNRVVKAHTTSFGLSVSV